MPPVPPENTGSPIAPINTYTATDITDDFPKITAVKYSTRVESDSGITPMGIVNGEKIHITAAKSEIITIFFKFSLDDVIFNLPFFF